MIDVRITNLDNAIRRLNIFARDLPELTFQGMRESAIFLQDRIREIDPKYARTLVISEYPSARIITIGPSIEYAPLRYMEERIKYLQFVCPWWKYLSKEIRELVPSLSELRDIVKANIDQIKNIIVENIKRGL